MLIQNDFVCPSCTRLGKIELEVPVGVKCVTTIYHCSFMLCRKYYLMAINTEKTDLFFFQELEKRIMDLSSEEEKKKHFALSFTFYFTDEVRERIEISLSDLIATVGIEKFIGSDLLTSEDFQGAVDSFIAEFPDPITPEEIEARREEFLSVLDRGQKLPW